ncbi:hypothetical protein SBA5_260028 [Candidatus Sulfotelmatomonas gaucii]|uniref:Uncharacterized protein n=1 Tax=Candidatus Sulfuritelmatomonas gaucii TaxID=2043161 RepID=A0A2N9LAL6_9BACT|nr:hypothetical protein SBA5_260028 [Candidatus Sulfotelmatomonas gaucii]
MRRSKAGQTGPHGIHMHMAMTTIAQAHEIGMNAVSRRDGAGVKQRLALPEIGPSSVLLVPGP